MENQGQQGRGMSSSDYERPPISTIQQGLLQDSSMDSSTRNSANVSTSLAHHQVAHTQVAHTTVQQDEYCPCIFLLKYSCRDLSSLVKAGTARGCIPWGACFTLQNTILC
jgi:hypothetical protein